MTRAKSTLVCGAVAMVCVLSVSMPAHAQTLEKRYQLIELRSQDGGSSRAYAVNDTGQIVGWIGEGSTIHSAHWQSRVVTDLHGTVHFELAHPYPLFSEDYGEAYDVSNSGQVVGTAKSTTKCGESQMVFLNAFLLRPGVLTDLATPYPGDALTNLRSFATVCEAPDSAATSISNRSHIVGWADRADGVIHAFLVAPEAGVYFKDDDDDSVNDLMVDLGTLSATADPVSSATAVNDLGQVTGYAYTNTADGQTAYRAFLITPLDNDSDGFGDTWFVGVNNVNTLMVDLGTLGGLNSWGRDVNNAGQVVGESAYDNAVGDHYTRAFVWQGGNMTDLGALRTDADTGSSSASAINEAGQVVGWAENDNAERRAFIYENGELKDLNDLLWLVNDDGTTSTVRVTLTEARDINEDGIIVGWGTVGSSDDAETRGFLLNPVMVDPSTAPDPNDTDNGDSDVGVPGGFDSTDVSAAPGTTLNGSTSSGTSSSPVVAPFLCGASSLTMLPMIGVGLLLMKRRY